MLGKFRVIFTGRRQVGIQAISITVKSSRDREGSIVVFDDSDSKGRIPYTTGEHVLLMTEDEKPLYQRELIEWRKSQVLKLWSKGWSQQRIANELKVTQATISYDLTAIHKQAQENIQNHLHETIPRQWTQCLEGLKTIMAEGWNIYDSISADATIRITDKTSVLALIKDCYKHMLDLNADSTIVSECINFSKRANNKLQSYQPQPQLPLQLGQAQPQLTQVEHEQQAEEQPLTQEEPVESDTEEVEQQ